MLPQADTKASKANTDTEGQTEDDGEGGELPLAKALCMALVMVVWIVSIVITFVLLVQANTRAVDGMCGRLREYMLFRVIGFTIEMLVMLFFFFDLETVIREYLGSPPLRDDQPGGLMPLLFGEDNPKALYAETLIRMLYNAGFAAAGAIIIPTAVMENAPCCIDALAKVSFTGTYTLAVIAWILFGLDCAQTAGRAVWLMIFASMK